MSLACSMCATGLPDHAVACPQCGSAVIVAETTIGADTSRQQVETSSPFFSALADSDKNLAGLSGWLILVGIGLVFGPLKILAGTLTHTIPLLTSDRYQPLLQSRPILAGLLTMEMATNIILVSLLAALNYLFFRKKRGFPTYMICFLALQSFVMVGDAVAARLLLPTTHWSTGISMSIARSVAAAAIWIPYFLVSRRVKVTFVN